MGSDGDGDFFDSNLKLRVSLNPPGENDSDSDEVLTNKLDIRSCFPLGGT